jgi:hypothetical protein
MEKEQLQLTDEEFDALIEAEVQADEERARRGLIVDWADELPGFSEERLAWLERRAAAFRRRQERLGRPTFDRLPAPH